VVLCIRDWASVRSSNRHILGLDIIRFAAALMVMVFHLAYWSWAPADSLTKSISGGVVGLSSLARFTWPGWVGVEVFFVISGFVILYSAADARPASFLRGRILRLYPAAWICASATLVTLLISGRADGDTAGNYARAMMLWIHGPWIDGVYWTLGIEIVFYALVFMMLCLGRFGSLRFAVGAMGLISSTFWIGLAFERMSPQHLPLGFLEDLLNSPASAFLLLRHGCFFALGAILWIAQTRRLTPWWFCLSGLCLLSGMLEITATVHSIVVPIGDSGMKKATAVAVWLVAFGFIVVAIRYQQALRTIFRDWTGVITFLGLMTYPLYLLHDIIGATLLRVAFAADIPPYGALALSMIGVLALSWAVTAFVEPPVKSWLRKLLSGAALPRVAGNRFGAIQPPPN